MSVSMACVLARHNDPLSMVIERAQKLLKGEAKEKYGRNAFAFDRTTGGRAPAGARIRQSDGAGSFDILQLFEEVHKAMLDRVRTQRRGLSGRIVSALDEVAGSVRLCSPEAQISLLRCLAARQFHADDRLAQAERDGEATAFQDTIEALYRGLSAWLDPDNRANRYDRPRVQDGHPLEVLVNLLATARFLTREGR
jgi:hypothetical protein